MSFAASSTLAGVIQLDAPACVVLAPFGMRPPRLVGQRGRRGGLLRMGHAGDQRAGGDGAADQAGGQEGTTLLVDRLRRA